MPSVPRQHKIVIEAINSLRDGPFSGWEVARLTAVPRSSITRVMRVLLDMGLLTYGEGQYDRWAVTEHWSQDLEEMADRYAWFVRSRRNPVRNLTSPPELRYDRGVGRRPTP